MADRNATHFGFAAAVLVLTAVLSPGMAPTQARAQDLQLQSGTDCSRLLAAEQTECVRTMRRLELRRLEEQGSITTGPDQTGRTIQRRPIPGTSGDPFSLDRHGAGTELSPGASSGMSGN